MKATRSSAIVIVITLLIGLIAGYAIWGKKEEKKLDVRQLLNKAMQEVDLIENKNKDLTSQLENMKDISNEMEKLSKENQDIQLQLKKAQQDNVQAESLLTQAKKEAETLSEKNRDIQQQLQKVQQDNIQLENLLTQVNVELSAVKGKVHERESLQSLSEDMKIRVSELEKENQELGNILLRIRSLTGEQKMDAPEDMQQEGAGKSENTGQ